MVNQQTLTVQPEPKIRIFNYTNEFIQAQSMPITKPNNSKRRSVMTRVQPYENVFQIGQGNVEWKLFEKMTSKTYRRKEVSKKNQKTVTTGTVSMNDNKSTSSNESLPKTTVGTTTPNTQEKKGRVSISWGELFN